jgi:hypothetical protein
MITLPGVCMIQMDQDTWEPKFYVSNMRANGGRLLELVG